jgi:hypothetical protein
MTGLVVVRRATGDAPVAAADPARTAVGVAGRAVETGRVRSAGGRRRRHVGVAPRADAGVRIDRFDAPDGDHEHRRHGREMPR